jgi:hypothetical protein
MGLSFRPQSFLALGEFCHEFSASVEGDSLREWISCEPSRLANICCLGGSLVGDLLHFEPACCRVDHTSQTSRHYGNHTVPTGRHGGAGVNLWLVMFLSSGCG